MTKTTKQTLIFDEAETKKLITEAIQKRLGKKYPEGEVTIELPPTLDQNGGCTFSYQIEEEVSI